MSWIEASTHFSCIFFFSTLKTKLVSTHILLRFFGRHPKHAQVPWPGIEPLPQLWQFLNLLIHQGTPVFPFINKKLAHVYMLFLSSNIVFETNHQGEVHYVSKVLSSVIFNSAKPSLILTDGSHYSFLSTHIYSTIRDYFTYSHIYLFLLICKLP